MELERPDINLSPVDLEPDKEEVERQTRSLVELGLPERLNGYLGIGEPVALPLTLDQAEADPLLCEFLSRESGFAFYAVYFACSFKPPPDSSFADAWFEIALAPQSGDAAPVAWSMNPEKFGDQEKITEKLTIGADAKFSPVSISGSAERASEYTGTDLHIEAFGIMTEKPAWEFIASKARAITGAYRLDMIVRVPSSTRVRVVSWLTANVEDRKFGIFKFRTPFSSDAKREITFG